MKPLIVLLIVSLPFVFGKLPDWLINKIDSPVSLLSNTEENTLTLTNGIISRTFLTSPGFVTIDFYSHEKNSSVLRALNPEVLSKTLTLLSSNLTIINTYKLPTELYWLGGVLFVYYRVP